ncbi:MAG: hypothetical protein CSA07_01080 [Bacteroidia bacterium]|nr:MAG: hypothetical protein CSA07_01080 [Bacteroidia bacterium]
MAKPFIVFLRNRDSLKFEYKRDVSEVKPTEKGYLVTFANGRSYAYGADRVRYYPIVSTRENVRVYIKGRAQKYHIVDDYDKHLILRGEDTQPYLIEKNGDIEICEVRRGTEQGASVVEYFKEILRGTGGVTFDLPAEEGEGKGANPNQISADILLKALEDIDLEDGRSVLSPYLDGVLPMDGPAKWPVVFPFGCNESQQLAVETALRTNMSIVEGPPGTGKTQTILNIVANIILRGKTVAIVSNNNSAVFNVKEKLEKEGYGWLVASLGRKENRSSFFENISEIPLERIRFVSLNELENSKEETKELKELGLMLAFERPEEAKGKLRELETKLMEGFQHVKRYAVLRAQLADAKTEFAHVRAEQALDPAVKSVLDRKFRYIMDTDRALRIKDLLSRINIENRLSLINQFYAMLKFGMLRYPTVRRYRHEFVTYVNHRFYELYINWIECEIGKVKKWEKEIEKMLQEYTLSSRAVLNGVLHHRYQSLEHASFSMENYRRQFDDFARRYPVVLSSTLSLHSSIPRGYLFDYLIIDEASQVDIIKSAVCFSCCRNAVIVGDSMQLTHIVDAQSKGLAEQLQARHSMVRAYDYVSMNILDSLKTLYGKGISSVLLREHYRCHPTIIGFCNKKFYGNELVVMKEMAGHPFRIIETNISGGRGNYNQRQIDETDLYVREHYAADFTRVGVIAPYRRHADMLQRLLPDGTEADTIHKFQGREKDVIIFNTVRDQIGPFIDNPNLINVAVSRAVEELIVVKPASMPLPHGTNIGDLIRYMLYTTDPSETVVAGRLRSVFDLLYKEYHRARARFRASNRYVGGSLAEQLVLDLLENRVLRMPQFSSIDVVREYRLRDLIRGVHGFSDEEMKFIRGTSSVDFLLYNRVDRSPVLAIEVDGVSYHSREKQQRRDAMKDGILGFINLPLLRLATDGHSEEARIIDSLATAMGQV